MELIENLLQLLVTFVGALLSGIAYRKSSRQMYFPAAVLLWLLCPWFSLLDAVSAAVRHHTARLLCVGVRLGGQPNLPAHFASHAHRTAERTFRCRRAWLAPAFGVPLLAFYCIFGDILSNLIWCGMMMWLSFCAIRGLVYAMGRRARRGICGISTSACCALRSRSICSGRWAASGRIPHRQAQPSGAICC